MACTNFQTGITAAAAGAGIAGSPMFSSSARYFVVSANAGAAGETNMPTTVSLGEVYTIFNNTANTLRMFPGNATSTINGLAAGAATAAASFAAATGQSWMPIASDKAAAVNNTWVRIL